MEDDTFKRIRSIVVNHFDIDPGKVSLMASFIDDLGSDSLDAIELVMAFEDAFDVMIPDNVVETMVTIQNTVDWIEQRKKPQRPGMPGS